MILIQQLSDKIEEEIKDASSYAQMALVEKEAHRWLADSLYSISEDEMKHMGILHDNVVRLINEYRENVGEPPADMLARYDYLHKRHIEAAKEAKLYQMMYREG